MFGVWHFKMSMTRKYAGKTLEIPGYSWVVPYEAAWKLVTKCPRNPRKRQFPTCSPAIFSFPVFHIVFPLFHRAFPMFPLVFLLVSYFRSYDSAIEFTADYSKDRVNLHHTFSWKLNPIQDRWQKGPTICFSPVTSTNVGISS